jgi:hypothetical protein
MPIDWIAAVSGLGIGAALTLLFKTLEEKQPDSVTHATSGRPISQ